MVRFPLQNQNLVDCSKHLADDCGPTFLHSATAVAAYKITTLEVLTFTDDFTCKAIVSL